VWVRDGLDAVEDVVHVDWIQVGLLASYRFGELLHGSQSGLGVHAPTLESRAAVIAVIRCERIRSFGALMLAF
jgi:hypothetical protein